MARPSRSIPDTGAYAALTAGLRARFPGDLALHRDLLAAATLDGVLAALARSLAAAAAVARRDPAVEPACAARAAALREILFFFARSRGGDAEVAVRRTRGGALRVRAGGIEHVWPPGRVRAAAPSLPLGKAIEAT